MLKCAKHFRKNVASLKLCWFLVFGIAVLQLTILVVYSNVLFGNSAMMDLTRKIKNNLYFKSSHVNSAENIFKQLHFNSGGTKIGELNECWSLFFNNKFVNNVLNHSFSIKTRSNEQLLWRNKKN